MSPSASLPSPPSSPPAAFLAEVLAGLHARPRTLPSTWFYDDRGSELFERITRLPEYYLTRTEAGILAAHAGDIVALLAPGPVRLVDLGAGNGEKAGLLARALSAQGRLVAYVPVDLSPRALDQAVRSARVAIADVTVEPMEADYATALRRTREAHPRATRLVLWLGSSVGNLVDAEAVALLRDLSNGLQEADLLLVGFDLLKAPDRLVAAYDDAAGVTAEFNGNLLRRINRELGGDFEPDGFVHHACFAPLESRMESYLISRRRQRVQLAGERFELEAWEPIRTEISCKYTRERIASLLQAAGLTQVASFADPAGDFLDVACRSQASRHPDGRA